VDTVTGHWGNETKPGLASPVDFQRGPRQQRLDLLAGGDELVAGDGVLEAGHGHAVGDAMVQIALEEDGEENASMLWVRGEL
jgi:hypothetical protein